MSTPIEQFLSKLTELERTMTKGPWEQHRHAHLTIVAPDNDNVAQCGSTTRNFDYEKLLAEQTANMLGIAHLKNTNSTVIAMLKAVVELRAALLIDSSISQTTTRRLLEFDAHLNTLATEALGTTGAKDE